jgi:methyl-accepting chemotaxis protein
MERLSNATRLNELAVRSEVAVKEMQSAMRGYLLNPENETFWKQKENADEENEKITKEMKTLTKDSELLAIFDEQSTFDSKELNPREMKLADLIKNKKIDEAKIAYVNEVLPVQSNFEKLAIKLDKKTDEAAELSILTTRKELSKLTWSLVVIAVLGITTITLAVVLLMRSIVKSLNTLACTLSNSAKEVASAATEISSTSIELSSAANEQASSIQETASSVVEVSAMVKKNAENAEKSGEVASQGAKSVDKGKVIVEEMLRAMSDINSSNSEIMKQTEQSNLEFSEIIKVIREINDKTKVINDIVFQTKLLAFNASVEAARAGDQGKGFAVVAEEVGNLAQMSGNAAKEITSLLDESILKVEQIVATSKTKVGGLIISGQAKVDVGTEVAKKTSAVLVDLVGAITDVNQLVDEIVTASKEQSQGVEEINNAVAQMEQVTLQNAAASHESASASAILSKQADVLRDGVQDLVMLVG